MPEKKTTSNTIHKVEIKPAKGRPMLTWVGKRPLRDVLAYPAQLVEQYTPEAPTTFTQDTEIWSDWPKNFPKSGLLFHGDNKDVLAYLLANGFRRNIKLIYIDPPFDSGADYIRKVELRGVKDMPKVDGEEYDLGEQIQYEDIWNNDNYLQFMYERISLIRELLSDDGSIYVHLDHRRVFHIKLILDEIFGDQYFRNEIIWHYSDKFATGGKAFDKNHDTILHYSKGSYYIGNEIRVSKEQKTKRALRKKVNGQTINVLDENGNKIIAEYSDKVVDDVWEIGRTLSKIEDVGFPTQKKEELIRRILEYGSNEGDLVLDCFIGSGTTASISQKLGRRWIGCDINKGAIQTSTKRLQDVIESNLEFSSKLILPGIETNVMRDIQTPAQLGFYVFRVNDYDLQIQHNEALNIACGHIGITRTKTDAFFEGTLGAELVKITPFNHPLTPLDLQEIQRELKNRPQEERNIVVVCLGKELATQEWIEDWNKNRKRTSLPNQIRVIEVRSDPKYGGLFIHKPCEADLRIERRKEDIEVEIRNFISPTILERLSRQGGVLAPKVEDWRAMVDSIMIDPNYNGEVFNIVLADIPEKKSDLVSGKYKLPTSEAQTTVAVKITDMLGEELLVTKEV